MLISCAVCITDTKNQLFFYYLVSAELLKAFWIFIVLGILLVVLGILGLVFGYLYSSSKRKYLK